MSYSAITDGEIEVGGALKQSTLNKVQDNFADHETRITANEVSLSSKRPNEINNIRIVWTAAASATLELKGQSADLSSANKGSLAFRSTTVTSGETTLVDISSNLSLTIPSGATLGTTDGAQSRLYIYAINNAGTVVLGISFGLLDENELHSSVAIDTDSDSACVLYASSSLENKAIRALGYIDVEPTTAGTWSDSINYIFSGIINEEQKIVSNSGSITDAITSSSEEALSNGSVIHVVSKNNAKVLIALQPNSATNSGIILINNSSTATATAYLYLYRGETKLAAWVAKFYVETGTVDMQVGYFPNLFYIDEVDKGTYTYSLKAKIVAGDEIDFTALILKAITF